MSWAYTECSDRDINVVLAALLGKLNLLTAAQSAAAKVAVSNQLEGDARGLLVYPFEEFSSPPPVSTHGGWYRHTWHTDHDYAGMYAGLVGALNARELPTGDKITPEQAFYASISMTNQRHGDATLSLFWRAYRA
jgi:hypothetical protein